MNYLFNKQIKDAKSRLRDLKQQKKFEVKSAVQQTIPVVFEKYIIATLEKIQTDVYLRIKPTDERHEIFRMAKI